MSVQRYLRWGIYVLLSVMVCLPIAAMAQIALSFNGQCGGLMPFLSGPTPCSFWEFFSGQVLLLLSIVWETYWPLVLLLVVLMAAAYLLNKSKTRSGRP